MLVNFALEFPTKNGKITLVSRNPVDFEPHELQNSPKSISEIPHIENTKIKEEIKVNKFIVHGQEFSKISKQLPEDIYDLENYRNKRKLKFEIPKNNARVFFSIQQSLKTQYDYLLSENLEYAQKISEMAKFQEEKITFIEQQIDPNLLKEIEVLEKRNLDFEFEIHQQKLLYGTKVDSLTLESEVSIRKKGIAEKANLENDEKIAALREELRLLEIDVAKLEINSSSRIIEKINLGEKLLEKNQYITTLLVEKSKMGKTLAQINQDNAELKTELNKLIF